MLNHYLILKGPTYQYGMPKDRSLGEYFIECIKKRKPEEIFCVDGITGEKLTCRDILEQTYKIVIILRELGVENEDVVAIISENCLKYCAALLAIYFVGAAANLLNPLYTTEELARVLNLTKPKVIFSSRSVFKKLSTMRKTNTFTYKILLLEKIDENENTTLEKLNILDTLLEKTEIESRKIILPKINSRKQTVLIILSSGTTGLPKCLMLTHENCRRAIGIFGDPDLVGMTPNDSTIAVLPFFHIFGNSSITAACVCSLKLIVLSSFKPDVYLRCIQDYKITLIYAAPPIVSFLVKHPLVKKVDLSSLKQIMCSGGCLSPELQNEFTELYPNAKIIQVYGATELSGVVSVRPPKLLSKLETVGRLIPGMEAMVWSRILGKNLGHLESGELCFRGPGIMKGYMDGRCNDIDNYGFYHTGDTGYYDEDGYFYIVGRIKEIIKYKGFQVAPAEIENILLKHTAVAECTVIGVPDERAGELPLACIVRQPGSNVTEAEIIDYVAERISVHKHLHGGVRFMDSIPRNAMGKALRDKLLKVCTEK